jgi:hypothetical protein
MPPAAAPPLAAAGALIAPAPPAVSLPPVLPRLQPAAPALNITTTTTTMMCLIFDFIAFLLHGLPALPGGFRTPGPAAGKQWTRKDTRSGLGNPSALHLDFLGDKATGRL